jgi:predicted nucleic acid-binding Zn finger protein
MKISDEIKIKAKKLLKEGKVKEEFETDKRIHFKVQGETEEHSVIFDKEKNEFSCDCTYFALKEKYCSHVEAVKLFLKKEKERKIKNY